MDEQLSVSTAPAAAAWPSAGSLFTRAWQIYKARAKTLLLISLAGMAIIFIASLVFAGGGAATGNSGALGLGMIVYLVVALVVGSLEQGALYHAISAPTDPGVGPSYKQATTRLGPLVWTAFLSSLLIIIGLIFFIIPGIIFIVWFCFSGFIVMLEGKSGIGALKASKAYVTGRWTKVAWYVLILILACIGLGIIFGIIAGFLTAASRYLGSAFNLAFSIAIVPLASAYIYVLYDTLRHRPQT
jgi:hypothetical protein